MKNGLSLSLITAATVLILSAEPARAGESHVVINGYSHHVNSSYDWNENNLGIGFEYEFEQRSHWKKVAMANGFRDSSESMSYMLGAGLHRRMYETDKLSGFYIYAGLNAFMMTRDDTNGGNPFPGLLPSISLGNDLAGINLTYLPKTAVDKMTNARVVDPTLRGVLFVQLKLSIENILP